VGCETNKGKLIGTQDNFLFVESKKKIEEFEIQAVGMSLFLHLRRLSDLTHEESAALIHKGFNIGRPKGYSFSPEAFLYLLTLHVDLFGLIELGFAKDLKSVPGAT
jgi:hypothetical protein